MVDNALDIICTINAEGHFISINPACFKIWGYQPEELIGRPFIEYVAPEDVAKTIATDASIESGNEATNFENRYIHKNGALIHMRWTAYWSENDKLVFCVAHDITERKLAEDQLRQSQEWLAAMFEASHDGIVVEENEHMVFVNRRYLQMYGYTDAAQVLGKHISLFQTPEDNIRMMEYGKKRARGEAVPSVYEFNGVNKKGSVINFEASISTFTSGGKFYIVTAQKNITERKLAEEKLTQLSSIVDSSNDAIISTDLDSIIISWNNGAVRLYGYAPREAIGKNVLLLFPPGREDEESRIMERIRSGESVEHYETVRVKKDGWATDVSLTISPIKNAAGEITGASKIARDITERKRTEEKLKDFAAQLERSNGELQDFASVASHDLQEPLRKVQAFGDRLQAKCGDSLNEEGRDYLERMQNAAGRMQILINDLLILSRVTTQTQPFTTVNLRGITEEVLSDLETRIETTNGTIEIGELATIEADPTQMRQLLQNLIGNALKFNRPGVSPVVKISGQICHDLAADNGETAAGVTYCLTVEDNGIGFEDKHVEKIFKVFQRLHSRSEYEGTGIGLAVCRKIAERHGGKITAHSVPGEGTTFTVILPVKQRKKVK
jgi:PAS domain S-box-containing protein